MAARAQHGRLAIRMTLSQVFVAFNAMDVVLAVGTQHHGQSLPASRVVRICIGRERSLWPTFECGWSNGVGVGSIKSKVKHQLEVSQASYGLGSKGLASTYK